MELLKRYKLDCQDQKVYFFFFFFLTDKVRNVITSSTQKVNALTAEIKVVITFFWMENWKNAAMHRWWHSEQGLTYCATNPTKLVTHQKVTKSSDKSLNWHTDYNISYLHFIGPLVFACVHNFFVWQHGQKLWPHNLACFIALLSQIKQLTLSNYAKCLQNLELFFYFIN